VPLLCRKIVFRQVKAHYDDGLVDWQIGMHCGVSTGTIQHWREENRLPPNGKGYLPGFISRAINMSGQRRSRWK
jgi:hypothetical protein